MWWTVIAIDETVDGPAKVLADHVEGNDSQAAARAYAKKAKFNEGIAIVVVLDGKLKIRTERIVYLCDMPMIDPSLGVEIGSEHCKGCADEK